jgi:magnesium transporter
MPKDEEADLLEELPEALRERLIASLPASEQATVTELMSHEPDTAGSLMNPEYLSVQPSSRVDEVLGVIRSRPASRIRAYGVLVTGSDGRLLGVLHLPDLAAADPERTAAEVMDADPVTARPEDSMEEVSEAFDRFNLLSAPVVDAEGQVEGIITVDDVVAWLREGEGREGGLT